MLAGDKSWVTVRVASTEIQTNAPASPRAFTYMSTTVTCYHDCALLVSLQVDHLRGFIMFRFSMGFIDTLIAKCELATTAVVHEYMEP